MGTFNEYNDRPNQIQVEGQEISLKFTNNGDGTGTISWNIPPPANGCSASNQAYNGIIITVSTQPADYLTTSPSDGFQYTGDPTVDVDLFTGNYLNTAMIVGAFYNDKTTTSLTITGLTSGTFYYASGYAVDNVGRYHREGVHSYSLATGVQKTSGADTSGYQDIGINSPVFTTLNDSTYLASNIDYVLHIRTNPPISQSVYGKGENVTAFYGKDYFITIPGREAMNYNSLIKSLNDRFKILDNPYMGANPPNAGTYYWDGSSVKVFDGNVLNTVDALVSANDPTSLSNMFWYNTQTNQLSQYVASIWQEIPVITFPSDFSQPQCGTLWFDGINAYEWEGDYWYKLTTYVQTFNPILPPVLDCSTYWYDYTNSVLSVWNDSGWNSVIPINSPYDPNTITTGSLWYNDTTSTLYKYVAGSWSVITTLRFDQPDQNGNISNPAPGIYWLNPQNNILYKRDPTNTYWIPQEYLIYDTDPTIRQSGQLWWNQSPSIDTLYVWDIVNGVWQPQEKFIQSYQDPSLPATLPSNAAWFNPLTNQLQYLTSTNCIDTPFIYMPSDPTKPANGLVWYNNSNFYIRSNNQWNLIDPYRSSFDPYNFINGYLWYNTGLSQLMIYINGQFIPQNFTTTSPLPNLNDEWYNTTNNNLYVWNGTAWVPQLPKVNVTLMQPDFFNYRYTSFLRFMTRDTGCNIFFEIIPEESGLFSYVKPSVIYHDPVPGSSGMDSGPSYKQIGVGTDGSPDARRELDGEIRRMLGAPSAQVELTKEQINQCIDYALLTLRKYSSYAYRRMMFFIDMRPNQQIYNLTNKCVGFNKITQVNGIFRLKSAFFRTGFAGNDMFGFAALQQLYTIGSFDMVSFHLMSQYIELLEQLFATKVMFQWVEERRELRLYQAITYKERMLLDANIEKTEQQLFEYRETAMWLKRWAIAEAKEMLSKVRGKYATLPGPNGATSLNAAQLAQEAETEKAALMEQVYDFSMQAMDDVGERGHFIQG